MKSRANCSAFFMTFISLFRININYSCLLFRIILILHYKSRNGMNIVRNNYILKIFSFISLGVLLLNIANKAVYTHSHQLVNGEIVTHAHPFDKQEDNTPLKSHEHTSLEFVLLDVLKFVFTSVFIISVLGIFLLYTKKKFFLKSISRQFTLHSKQNKSPPFEIVF